jgi:hypothetical protein
MSFDPRSLERLRELGRRLPQPLPAPVPPPAKAKAKAELKRHKVETEDNPEQLFRELMQASPDGSVPEHLLDRLRQLESERRRPSVQPVPMPGARRPLPEAARPVAAADRAGGRTRPVNRGGSGRRDPRLSAEQADLYTAFQQLLLEDDEAD